MTKKKPEVLPPPKIYRGLSLSEARSLPIACPICNKKFGVDPDLAHDEETVYDELEVQKLFVKNAQGVIVHRACVL